MTVYHLLSCIIHYSTLFIICLAPPSAPPPSILSRPERLILSRRLLLLAAVYSASRQSRVKYGRQVAHGTAAQGSSISHRCHGKLPALPPNPPQTFSSSSFYLPPSRSSIPIHLPPQRHTESLKEKKYSSLTGEKNTCGINLRCDEDDDSAAPESSTVATDYSQNHFFWGGKIHFGYLACELSSGAVTRCRLLSLLKTSALPLAKTPQPKLTSAPRSEEKLW